MQYDVVVVGAGAAGLSAALMLARSLRSVAVVDDGDPRNAAAEHLYGFLSRDGGDPAQLLEIGGGEVRSYGGEILDDEVVGIERSGESAFDVQCTDTALSTRAVIVATGLRDVLPDIDGLQSNWGRTVIHCPYCHGYEVRGLPLAVLGGDNRPFTLLQASLIRQWSADVAFFPNRIELTSDERDRLTARGVHIVDGVVGKVESADDRTISVILDDGTTLTRSAVFIGPQFVPRHELLTALGCVHGENGWVTTDPTGQTSVHGVWAAGNVSDSPAQLINAAGSGSKAGIAVNHYLLEQDVQRAVARVQNTSLPAPQ